MADKSRSSADAVNILHRRYFQGRPARMRDLEDERANAAIARMVHDLRIKAGLTQARLAELVGTQASVICRLEDADYDGHSLSMLQRIAAALNKRVQIRFVALKHTKSTVRRRKGGDTSDRSAARTSKPTRRATRAKA